MSDGVAHNAAAGTAATGEAVAVTSAAPVANAAPVALAAPSASPAPAAIPAPAAVAAATAAVAVAPAPAAAVPQAADCAPPKKKVAHDAHAKKEGEEHARADINDEDQNLSQPADGCVLPQSGQAAPVAPQEGAAAPAGEAVGGGGGISSGLLIGAGVLAAVGVGVLALGGDKEEPNVAPTANADTAAVNEGSVVTGSVRTNDTDPNSKDTLTYTISGTAPAGLTLNSDGTYTFDANNAAYNSLAAGATQVVTANYNVSDGRGGTASSTLTITVTGTNDNPVAVADTGPASTEGGAAVTGSVATNDSDPDTGAQLTYTLVSAVPGLTLNTNGTYSFNPADAAYNSLAAGQQQTVVANYRVADAQGGSATSTLTLVVTGTNDIPTVVSDTAAVNEDATVTGNLRTNDSDPDTNDTLTYTVVGTAPVGLTVNSNGTFTFNAAQTAYQSLAVGQTQVVTATIAVTDGKSTPINETLTITITGTNDAPVATAAVAAATEDGAPVTGQLVGTDVDQGAALTYSLNAAVPGLTINPNGTYSFDPSNSVYNSLSAGQTQAVVANYTVTDAQGASSTSTLTITVTGTNDAPTIVSDTAAVNEDATISGNLRTNDSDPDTNDTLTYTVVGSAPVGLTVNPNGTYTFNAAQAAYQDLAVGQLRVVTATVAVTDGISAPVNETLTITIIGTNDAPVAVAAVAAATENGAVVTGQVTGTDVDQGAVLTFSPNSSVAGLTLNSDGTYSFDPSNPAYNSLAAGQTQAVVANFTVTDAQGASSTSALTITVTGTNDAPVATAAVNAGLEDTVITGTLVGNASDPDVGDTRTFAVVGTAPAGFNLNANGTYTLDTRIADYQNLTAGQVQPVVVTYRVTDSQGLTSDATLTISVTGVVETVNLDIDDDNNIGTARFFEAGLTDFNFTDDDVVASNVIVNRFGADDILFLDGDVSSYTFLNGDFDSDGIADDIRITSNVGGAAGTIILTDAITAGTTVTNEAQAEAAIGPGADNFRFVVTQSLEFDSDNNPNTVQVFDAGSGSFRYVDDADAPNLTAINNFGANDRIVLEAGNTYSFTNRNYDNVGGGNDLEITINKNGVSSQLFITNVVNSDAVTFNEATVETALNRFFGTTNVDYIQFG